ncbi:MAG: hypothetical protein Q9220_007512 [cf. Caloplaca sp. 1 TL-2023]
MDPFVENDQSDLQAELARLRLDNLRQKQQLQHQDQQLQNQGQQLQRQNQQLQPTTFLELLQKSHEVPTNRIQVETKLTKATTGKVSSVSQKLRPKSIRLWTDFLDLRKAKFEHLVSLMKTNGEEARWFDSYERIEVDNIPTRVSSEIDLRLYHCGAVQMPVEKIIRKLISKCPQARDELKLGQEMSFENHANSIRVPEGNSTIKPPDRPVFADQLCIKNIDDDRTSIKVVIEFKAPHKITTQMITAGLREMSFNDIVRATSPPDDPSKKFEYYADRFIAMIITQVYSYMVESGISHGCIVTGEDTIFLLIQRDDPYTVFFFHANPKEELKEMLDQNGQFDHECTAIAQLLTFCMMAHQHEEYSQSWRQRVRERGLRWDFDDQEPIKELPLNASKAELPGSVYKPRKEITAAYRSPILSRSKTGCGASTRPNYHESESDPDDDPNDYLGPTPSKQGGQRVAPRATKTDHTAQQGKEQTSSRRSAREYSYCTHRCLQGVVNRTPMDVQCPNFALHPQGKSGVLHALTRSNLARLLRQQLLHDRDNYCIDLQRQGATGMAFKLTLASHAYTLIGKGTIKQNIETSKHEGRVYRRLKQRQGLDIPVFLGNIDLYKPWIGLGVDIEHMLLLSFAGDSVGKKIESGEKDQFQVYRAADNFVTECLREGACHTDNVWARNILLNAQTGQTMYVDFDRTILFDPRRPARKVLGECSSKDRLMLESLISSRPGKIEDDSLSCSQPQYLKPGDALRRRKVSVLDDHEVLPTPRKRQIVSLRESLGVPRYSTSATSIASPAIALTPASASVSCDATEMKRAPAPTQNQDSTPESRSRALATMKSNQHTFKDNFPGTLIAAGNLGLPHDHRLHEENMKPRASKCDTILQRKLIHPQTTIDIEGGENKENVAP